MSLPWFIGPTWRAETELAGRIIVNSSWSAQCLVDKGVSAAKINVVPCAYDAENNLDFQRAYPERFSADRPLEVLFLGQVVVRKGIHLLLQVAERMQGRPIRFTIVGAGQDSLLKTPLENVRWIGAVRRQEAAGFYREADVFILPTLSDGFGLTQLEALSWKLPVLATKHCGDVVVNGVNGILLEDYDPARWAGTLDRLISEPEFVKKLSAGTAISSRFSLDVIGRQLLDSVGDET